MQISSLSGQAPALPVASTNNDAANRRPEQAAGAAGSPAAAEPPAQAVLTAQAVQGAQKADSTQQLQEAVKKLNEMVQMFSNGKALNFSIDNEADAVVVKVVDQQTDEVVRQIPSEEAIAIAKAIDQFQGMLIKDRA